MNPKQNFSHAWYTKVSFSTGNIQLLLLFLQRKPKWWKFEWFWSCPNCPTWHGSHFLDLMLNVTFLADKHIENGLPRIIFFVVFYFFFSFTGIDQETYRKKNYKIYNNYLTYKLQRKKKNYTALHYTRITYST